MAHSTMPLIHRVSLSLIQAKCLEVADQTGDTCAFKAWVDRRETTDFRNHCHESELQLPLGFARTPRKGEKK